MRFTVNREWESWFAWYPVHLEGTMWNERIWWERIERYWSSWGHYIYRELEK